MVFHQTTLQNTSHICEFTLVTIDQKQHTEELSHGESHSYEKEKGSGSMA